MKKITFNKNATGQWFADIPEWTGDQAELEMVMGADTFLDILSQDESSVTLLFYTSHDQCNENFWTDFILKRTKPYNDGYYYDAIGHFNTLEVWLCHVTKFVFDEFPEKIFVSCLL